MNRSAVGNFIKTHASTLDPVQVLQIIQMQQAMQQAKTTNRSQYAQQLGALAQTGMPQAQAAPIASAYTQNLPGLGPNSMDTIQNQIYQGQQTSPLAVGAGAPAPLAGEDYAAIDTTLTSLINQTQPGNNFPYGVHEATMFVIAPLRAQGYDEQTLATVQNYIHQRWAQLGGA